jgi:hypothetical protein
VVLVGLVGLTGWWVAGRGPAENAADGSAARTPAPSASPSGRTAEASIPPVDEVAVDPPAETAGGNVGVVLSYVGWEQSSDAVEAGGFVSGVVEGGGTCRLTLTRGERSAVAETQGEADASTTVCGAIVVPGQELSEGTWKAVLSYESATASGVSAPVDVEVPSR